MALWPRKPKSAETAATTPAASAPLAAAPPHVTPQQPAHPFDAPPAPPPVAPPVAPPVKMPTARQASPALAASPSQAEQTAAGFGQTPAALTAQEVQKRAIASKHLMASFGEIVAVLMRTPQFRAMPLSELEGLVMPALMTGQFLVAEAQSKSNGFLTPIAAALWATVSEDVDRRLSENPDQPFRLAASEWKCGPIPWMIAVIGDQRVIKPMLKQLQETTLKGRPFKMRVKGNDGRMVVSTLSAIPESPAPSPPPD
jgi:hemolysin-activating ACP:hemolysin acyltransferase